MLALRHVHERTRAHWRMLEYTRTGDGPPLAVLVLYEDPKREYVYGPALGWPDTKVRTFLQG